MYKHKRPWVVVGPSVLSGMDYDVLWAPVVRVTRERVLSRHVTYKEAVEACEKLKDEAEKEGKYAEV